MNKLLDTEGKVIVVIKWQKTCSDIGWKVNL